MTFVHFVQADGLARREHLHVPIKGRRRLSAVLREYDLDTGRREPIVVSISRPTKLKKLELKSFVDVISKPGAEAQLLRRDYSKTLVGRDDVITITYLPLGGGGSQGGNRGAKTGLAIGASIAAILLAVAAPFAVPAIATAMGFAAGSFGAAAVGVAYAGVIIGLNYLASRASEAKANKESDSRPLYGVSGGGNLPKPGDRIPVIYGQVWTTPALSQPDYSVYQGEDQILFKRMTIGCGEYRVVAVRIGTQEVWRNGAYLNGLGSAVTLEYVAPGALSTIVPSSVTASPDVVGIELPRPGSAPEWAGPYRIAPSGVEVTILQFNYILPGGLFVTGPQGGKFAGTSYAWFARPLFEYALADGNGNPIGAWTRVPEAQTVVNANSQKPIRRTVTVTVPKGQYVVRAKNDIDDIPANQSGSNTVTWDFAGGYIPETQLRPGISELAMTIKAGPGLAITQFSQIEVLVQRKLPVWRGGNFTVQESSKALDAFVDIALDPNYGAGMPPELIDLGKVTAYLNALTKFDTYNDQINGPISVWEAWSVVLGPMRAEPVQRGAVISFQRDEQQAVRRHHFSRRQIISGSSTGEMSLNRGEGIASIRSEFFTGGDPRRRNEVTARYGPESLASTLVNFAGVTDHEHATHLVRWFAAAAFYRRETRRFRIELAHRSLLPGDPIGLETWFFAKGISLGLVAQIPGNIWRFSIDGDAVWPAGRPSPLYAYIIDRQGREFGPLFCDVNESQRWIDFNPGDVTAVEASSGLTFAQVLQPDDGGLFTHVRVGTITELNERWIVRSIRPVDALTADIEVVNDAPEVWAAIGEGYTEPPEVFPVEETDPPIPTVRWVNVTVAQVAQGLVCRWAVSPARGALGYAVELSRDGGANWGEVSSGPATTGEFTIEHIPTASNRLRARAWGRFGVPGPWVVKEFSTNAEAITGVIADAIDTLNADLARIDEEGKKAAEQALKLLDEQYEEITDAIDRLAAAQATHAGQTLQNVETTKIATEQAFSGLQEEQRLRIEGLNAEAFERNLIAARVNDPVTGLAAQGGILTTYGTRITNTENGVSVNSSALETVFSELNFPASGTTAMSLAVQSLSTTVSSQGGTLTAQGQAITAIQSELNFPASGTTNMSLAVQSLSTAVSAQGGVITAQGSAITTLQAQVAGVGTVSLTQLQSVFASSNGTNQGMWGVVMSDDAGVVGGFRWTGIRRADGTVVSSFGISGNLIVDGEIFRGKVALGEITRFKIGGSFTNTGLTTTPTVFYTFTFTLPDVATVDVDVNAVVPWQGSPNNLVFGELRLNGTNIIDSAGVLAANAFWKLGGQVYLAPGTYTLSVRWWCNVNGGATVFKENITIRESYR